MTTLYKLTEQDGTTYNQSTQWGENTTHMVSLCSNPQLCTGDVLHAYTSLELALLLNPIHADIVNPLVWLAEGDIVVEDWGKVGCFSLTTVEEIPLPNWYTDTLTYKRVLVQFAVLCAESVIHLYEQHSNNQAPRKAIETAKNYLNNIYLSLP